MLKRSFHIYSDGSCLGNPGPGGYASIIIEQDKSFEVTGMSRKLTTNNQMELEAIIKGYEKLHHEIAPDDLFEVDIFVDSSYVKDGITSWIKQWKSNGWKTAKKKPVKNSDLWKSLDTLIRKSQEKGNSVRWNWVKAHNGDPLNEKVDKLAKEKANLSKEFLSKKNPDVTSFFSMTESDDEPRRKRQKTE